VSKKSRDEEGDIAHLDVLDNQIINYHSISRCADTQSHPSEVKAETKRFGPFSVGVREHEDLDKCVDDQNDLLGFGSRLKFPLTLS
jgi:hypothetical protein